MKKLTFLLITKRVESLLQAIQYGQKKYRAFITLAMNTRYGASVHNETTQNTLLYGIQYIF